MYSDFLLRLFGVKRISYLITKDPAKPNFRTDERINNNYDN